MHVGSITSSIGDHGLRKWSGGGDKVKMCCGNKVLRYCGKKVLKWKGDVNELRVGAKKSI